MMLFVIGLLCWCCMLVYDDVLFFIWFLFVEWLVVFIDKDGMLIDDVFYNMDFVLLWFRLVVIELLKMLVVEGFVLLVVIY